MSYPIRTIVAGIAALDERDPLLAPAIQLAERTGATLHLVHAFELPDLMWDAYARMGYMSDDSLHEYTARIQSKLEARVSSATASERVRCRAIAGPAAPAIQDVAAQERAGLILVGATRHGTLARTILGTTAQRVLRGAPAPVLVLRGPLPRHPQRVLLTTDLSPFSAGIHELGLDFLESLFGADQPELRSLLVVSPGMPLPSPLRPETLKEIARGELDRFLGERKPRPRSIQGVLRFGDPAKEILAEAVESEADLVILGTHGRPAPQRWLLGSVAEATIRGAMGSVLVIPAGIEQWPTPSAPRNTSPAVPSPDPAG